MNSYAPLSTGSSNENTTSTQRTRLDSTDSIVYIDESESDEVYPDDKSGYHHSADDDVENNTRPTEVKKATGDQSNCEDFDPYNNFDSKNLMQSKSEKCQMNKDITISNEQFKTSVQDRQVDQRDTCGRCSCESGKYKNKVEIEDEVKVKPMETISREIRHNDDKISHYSADFDPFTDSKLNLYEPRLEDTDLELFLRRDKNIHEYQNMNKCLATLDISHRRTLDDFRRKLAMLKTQCLVLTGGLVIIIIFYAATTVYYLSNGTSRYDMEDIEFTVERFLDSSDVRKDFRNQVLCVTCDDVSYDVMSYFRRQDGLCCIKDIGSLSHSLKTSYYMDVRNQNTRLFNLTRKFSELEQKVSYQNFVLNLGEDDGSSSDKVVKYDKVLEEAYAKIEKNERMINTILERQRSSLHIVGRVNNDQLRWEYKDGSIKPKLDINSVTFPINGGTYFLYGNIKFSCKNSMIYDRVSVGYQLDELGFRGRSQIIASVQQECLNGTNSDIDVVLQQIISVPLNQGKNVRFTLFDATSHFVSDMHDHSFGLFEI